MNIWIFQALKRCGTFFILSFCLMTAQAESIWVSDEIEAPLRQTANMNAEIVDLLRAGQEAEVIRRSDDGAFVEIKLSDGRTGWLSNYYVLTEESVHAKYASVHSELAAKEAEVAELKTQLATYESDLGALKSQNDSLAEGRLQVSTLQQEKDALNEMLVKQNESLKQMTAALAEAEEKANAARVNYLSLVKTNENLPSIAERNQQLEENNIKLTRDIQLLTDENQVLKAQIGGKEKLIGGMLVVVGLVFGYILSVLFPTRRKMQYDSSL